MKTLKINRNWYGFNTEEELVEKIYRYVSDCFAWDYENDDFANDGKPNWTFSGSPNGDELTSFVRKQLYGYYDDEREEDIEGYINSFTFSGEEDRLRECRRIAEEITGGIE